MTHTIKNAVREHGVDTAKASKLKAQNTVPLQFKQQIKNLIVSIAMRELIPFRLAEWIIRRGGLRNA